jgi:hypothetical protein
VDPSYAYTVDLSLPDNQIHSRHIHYDLVLGGDALLTAMKDEGAANCFISETLVDELEWRDVVQPLTTSETKNFSGMGGAAVPVIGKLCHI